jgi:hypothetical protein
MTTPIFDSVLADLPYPTTAVDTAFYWVAPVVRRAPRPGQKPIRKHKKNGSTN